MAKGDNQKLKMLYLVQMMREEARRLAEQYLLTESAFVPVFLCLPLI